MVVALTFCTDAGPQRFTTSHGKALAGAPTPPQHSFSETTSLPLQHLPPPLHSTSISCFYSSLSSFLSFLPLFSSPRSRSPDCPAHPSPPPLSLSLAPALLFTAPLAPDSRRRCGLYNYDGRCYTPNCGLARKLDI